MINDRSSQLKEPDFLRIRTKTSCTSLKFFVTLSHFLSRVSQTFLQLTTIWHRKCVVRRVESPKERCQREHDIVWPILSKSCVCTHAIVGLFISLAAKQSLCQAAGEIAQTPSVLRI